MKDLPIEHLVLSKNKIVKLPKNIGKLGNLVKLELSEMPKVHWEDAFELLQEVKTLEALIIDNADMVKLPANIVDLKQLKILSLNNNQLRELPATLGQVSGLTALYLNNNALPTLPEALKDLENLQWLEAENTGLNTIEDKIKEWFPNATIKL